VTTGVRLGICAGASAAGDTEVIMAKVLRRRVRATFAGLLQRSGWLR